ncbi:hypothetical protein P152DRAFT_472504 [Eremomyces bilateralis CBS 781.70]|uniref:Up-regulated during septation protein 1 domain-containing protein n=1 Tax=Eremomyces bilateralis CBS 781.70 TaxID=1392243 RepID=A0A6G1G6W5_9PEZI|nr:uncharacterized protein P152DRAFT_472504 [Eremomyces bilateralis CBS 781.70]KAF1813676.1 hypothetical protein P152DRAFT_472504 [Eremomyces bilateralis CBS 781.70]
MFNMFRSANTLPPTTTLLDTPSPLSPPTSKSLPPLPRPAPNPRDSVQLPPDDPVAVHLLVETALGDSREYEVLSVADVDALKSERELLTARIEGLRRKLALESKVVEAASSFGRMHTNGGSPVEGNDEDEVVAAQRKCEEVARELYLAEGRLVEVQGRLLKHTAGILQMTHAGLKKRTRGRDSTMGREDGRPDSPASIYAYENTRKSMFPDEAFDVRSFYRLPDNLDSLLDPTNLNGDPRWANGSVTPERSEQFLRQTQEIAATTQRLVELNQKMRETLAQNRQEVDAPPPTEDLSQQIDFLEGGLDQLREINQSMHSEKSRNHEQLAQAEKLQVTLEGLWQIIVGEEDEQRQQKNARRERALPNEDISDDESDPVDAEFSLPHFSTKIQWLVTQSTRLKEQQNILQRQIQQQREMKEKSDSEQVTALKQQLDQATSQSESSKAELLSQLEQSRHELTHLQASQASQTDLQTKLDDVLSDLHTAEASLAAKDTESQSMSSEIERLEGEVVRLQTDVTIARAELDGAYGTRAQRAAEVAASHSGEAKQKEAALRTELAETLAEFEELTRATVEAEKEREGLEGQVDGLRDMVGGLERELSEERVKWLGATGGNGGPVEGTSTAVLRNEFRRMMRDTRGEHMKALRAEQEVIRKLEAQIRSLKQGPGKSSLSQVTMAR